MHARAICFLSSLYFILLCCANLAVILVCFGRFLTWFKFSALKTLFLWTINYDLCESFSFHIFMQCDDGMNQASEGIIITATFFSTQISDYQILSNIPFIIWGHCVYFWVNHNFSVLILVTKYQKDTMKIYTIYIFDSWNELIWIQHDAPFYNLFDISNSIDPILHVKGLILTPSNRTNHDDSFFACLWMKHL